ncbi:MAG: VTT domain-containing protein [Patescibacteria group bacterium]
MFGLDTILRFIAQFHDVVPLIKTAGYIGIAFIVFAESGLFFGFFLPGDSLLFTAGFLASQDYLNIWVLCLITFLAAVLGDSVGYAFGRSVGPRLFKREDSIIFHKKHLQTAEKFYERNGPKTIVIARFMPVVRTFAPIVAGIGKMRYRTFISYNLVGGAVWGIGMPTIGYFLGSTIPDVDRYLLPIIILIVFLSIAPGIIHLLRAYFK